MGYKKILIAFIIGMVVGGMCIYFIRPKGVEIVEDRTKIDSLQREVIKLDCLIDINEDKQTELKERLSSLSKDSTRIITRYETRIKYIDSYTPDQLDSVLAARYPQD